MHTPPCTHHHHHHHDQLAKSCPIDLPSAGVVQLVEEPGVHGVGGQGTAPCTHHHVHSTMHTAPCTQHHAHSTMHIAACTHHHHQLAKSCPTDLSSAGVVQLVEETDVPRVGQGTPPCTQHHAHSTMHTPPCTQHHAHSIMHTPPCTHHHAHTTMHTPPQPPPPASKELPH